MRPLRLLFVISKYPPLGRGGAEISCRRMATALARDGHQVTILTQSTGSELRDSVEDGVHVLRVVDVVAFGPLWGMTYTRGMRRWIERTARDWDLVVCWQLYLHSGVAAEIARRLGKKSATRHYGAGPNSDITLLREHRDGAALVREALQCDAFFALSRAVARELHAEGVGRERIFQYLPPVDPEKFRRSTEVRENEFLFVGRFTEIKNIPLLIRAFEHVADEHPQARLRLLGGGDLEVEVRAMASNSRANHAIIVESWLEDVTERMASAGCIVSATRSEGMSNVLLESLCCGVPVIYPDVSGVRDILDAGNRHGEVPAKGWLLGRGGMITRPGDVDSLVSAMTEILTNPERRRGMAAAARALAEEILSDDAALDGFVKAARAILNGESAEPVNGGYPPEVFQQAAT